MKKNILIGLLVSTMLAGALSGCGGDTATQATTEADNNGSNSSNTVSKDAIRFVNTKIEIDKPLKAFAQQYKEQTGQEVSIESLGGGVDVNGQLKNYLAAGNMPDIYGFGPDAYNSFKDYLMDLSNESWVSDTDFNFKGDDGKVYGCPFAIEGIGLVYNADILQKASIDPKTLTNINAYKDAFEKIDAMKDELGLQAVCSVAAESGQMYWSTGNHIMASYLSMGLSRDDKKYIDMLNEGKLDKERALQFADFLQLLFDYSDRNVLISGTYDDQLALWAQGKTAFITQGNWIDPSLPDYNVSFNCGIAPYAFMTEDTPSLLADSPTFWGIYSDTKKADAAKAFINALVNTQEGQEHLVKQCGTISPYKSCTIEPDTPLSASMIPYIKEGSTYAWDWLYQPEGIAQNATGAVFELYAKGEIDKNQFVDMLETAIADYVSANSN